MLICKVNFVITSRSMKHNKWQYKFILNQVSSGSLFQNLSNLVVTSRSITYNKWKSKFIMNQVCFASLFHQNLSKIMVYERVCLALHHFAHWYNLSLLSVFSEITKSFSHKLFSERHNFNNFENIMSWFLFPFLYFHEIWKLGYNFSISPQV